MNDGQKKQVARFTTAKAKQSGQDNLVHAENKFIAALDDEVQSADADVTPSGGAVCADGVCVLNWRPKRAGAA